MIFSPAPLRSGHAFEFENLHLLLRNGGAVAMLSNIKKR
jgi:hypothetical protein